MGRAGAHVSIGPFGNHSEDEMAKKKTATRPAGKKGSGAKAPAKRPAMKTARTAERTAKKAAVAKAAPARREAPAFDALLAPVKGASKRDIGHVQLEVGRAGGARVKRMIYPPGFRWSVDMKPNVGTALCMHAHVGFLARGEIHIEYADGCVIEHKAPQIVAIDPGHDGWVVGGEPVVLIEFDFEGDTINRLGMPTEHKH